MSTAALVRPLYHREAATPIGSMTLVTDGAGALVALDFAPTANSFTLRRLAAEHAGDCLLDTAGKTTRACTALEEFFAGRRRAFDDIPLALRGTAFQLAVWAELRRIPFGETRSYGQIAAALGKPGAARAVGRANGANPIPLVVPCHRVIGANGALTGFSAVGGVETKRRLLAFERRSAPAGADGSSLQIEIDFAGSGSGRGGFGF